MSYNIQSALTGLDTIAAAILEAAPDLVVLQEVDHLTTRAEGRDQTAELASRVGLPHHTFVRATEMHGGGYGLALLSRYPIEEVYSRPLRVGPGMEERVLARSVVRIGETEVSIYKAHLTPMPHRGRIREEQIRAYLQVMSRDPRPKLLLGDLNANAASAPIQRLSSRMQDAWLVAGEGKAGTYPLPLIGAVAGTYRFDYVFACDAFAVRRAFVLPSNASDHYPMVADLELVGGRGLVAESL